MIATTNTPATPSLRARTNGALRSLRWLLAPLAVAVLAAPARADDAGSPFGGELRLQIGFGGDRVASVTYSDGSESDLNLGTYGLLGLGGIYSPWRSAGHAVELELLAGFGTWSTGPENTEDRISLTRFPLELLGYYRYQLSQTDGEEMFVRGGGGVTWHLIDGISGSGSLEGVDIDLDDAVGAVFEAAFVYTIVAAGARYTLIDYRAAAGGDAMDASSLAFFVSLILEPGL